jgi:hypothetical protein
VEFNFGQCLISKFFAACLLSTNVKIKTHGTVTLCAILYSNRSQDTGIPEGRPMGRDWISAIEKQASDIQTAQTVYGVQSLSYSAASRSSLEAKGAAVYRTPLNIKYRGSDPVQLCRDSLICLQTVHTNKFTFLHSTKALSLILNERKQNT